MSFKNVTLMAPVVQLEIYLCTFHDNKKKKKEKKESLKHSILFTQRNIECSVNVLYYNFFYICQFSVYKLYTRNIG